MPADSASLQDASAMQEDLHTLLDHQRQAYAAHPFPPFALTPAMAKEPAASVKC